VTRESGRTRESDPSQPGSGFSSSEHPALPASWRGAIPIAAALFGCGVLAAAEVWLRTWLPGSLGPLLALLGTGAGVLMGGRLAELKRASRLMAAHDDRGPDILNQQMLSVTELSETTAASILKNLTGVDVQITAC